MSIQKYLHILKISWQTSLEYRFDFLMGFIVGLIPIGGFIFLWLYVYSVGKSLGTYNLSFLVTYYFISSLFNFLLLNNARWIIQNHIKTGFLSTHLLKPQNYLAGVFATVFGQMLLSLLIISLIFSILTIFFPRFFLLPQSSWQVPVFFLIFFIAFILNFLISCLFGFLGFWIVRISGLHYIYNMIYSFFAGFYLPLDLFPSFWKDVASILPFQYLFYFPVKIFLGQISPEAILKGFLIQFFWFLFLLWSTVKLWQKGLKQYEAVGA